MIKKILLSVLLVFLYFIAFPQYTGKKYVNDSYEFIYFLNDTIVEYAIHGSERCTFAVLYKGIGKYLINDSIFQIALFKGKKVENYIIAEKGITEINSSKISFYDFFSNDDKIVTYFTNVKNEFLRVDTLELETEFQFELNEKYEKLIIEYNLGNCIIDIEQIKGKVVNIEFIDCVEEVDTVKMYNIQTLNDTTINLIGPIIPNYKRLNRIRHYQSFLRTYPWKWSFINKQQLFSPRERLMFLESN